MRGKVKGGADALSLQARGLSRRGAQDLLGGVVPHNPVDRLQAVNASKAMGAMAFTQGSDIAFGAPPSRMELLAHEMARRGDAKVRWIVSDRSEAAYALLP